MWTTNILLSVNISSPTLYILHSAMRGLGDLHSIRSCMGLGTCTPFGRVGLGDLHSIRSCGLGGPALHSAMYGLGDLHSIRPCVGLGDLHSIRPCGLGDLLSTLVPLAYV